MGFVRLSWQRLSAFIDKVRRPIPPDQELLLNPFEKCLHYAVFPTKFVFNVIVMVLLLLLAFCYHTDRYMIDTNTRFALSSMFFSAADFTDGSLEVKYADIADVQSAVTTVVQAYYTLPEESVGTFFLLCDPSVSSSPSSASSRKEEEDGECAIRSPRMVVTYLADPGYTKFDARSSYIHHWLPINDGTRTETSSDAQARRRAQERRMSTWTGSDYAAHMLQSKAFSLTLDQPLGPMTETGAVLLWNASDSSIADINTTVLLTPAADACHMRRSRHESEESYLVCRNDTLANIMDRVESFSIDLDIRALRGYSSMGKLLDVHCHLRMLFRFEYNAAQFIMAADYTIAASNQYSDIVMNVAVALLIFCTWDIALRMRAIIRYRALVSDEQQGAEEAKSRTRVSTSAVSLGPSSYPSIVVSPPSSPSAPSPPRPAVSRPVGLLAPPANELPARASMPQSAAENAVVVDANGLLQTEEEIDRDIQRRLFRAGGPWWRIYGIVCDVVAITTAIIAFVEASQRLDFGDYRVTFILLLAISCFMETLLFVSYIQSSPRFYVVMKCLAVVIPKLFIYSVSVAPIWAGFAYLAYAVFSFTPIYETYSLSLITLFTIVNGDSLLQNFTEIQQVDFWLMRLYTRLFQMSFLAFMFCLALNILLAVVVDSYEDVKSMFNVVQFERAEIEELIRKRVEQKKKKQLAKASTAGGAAATATTPEDEPEEELLTLEELEAFSSRLKGYLRSA